MNNQRLSKGSEESAPREVCSGDIVQFGVDVMENSRKGTFLEQKCQFYYWHRFNMFHSHSRVYCGYAEIVFTRREGGQSQVTCSTYSWYQSWSLKCKACFYFFRSPSTGIQDEEEISELCKQDLYQLNQWIQVRNKIELPTNNVDFSTCWSIYRKLSFASKY